MNYSIIKISFASFFALASIALNTSNSQTKVSIPVETNKISQKRELTVKKIKIDTLLSRIDTINKSLKETKKTLIATSHMQDNIISAIQNLKDSTSNQKSQVVFDTIVVQKVIEKEIEREVIKQDSVIIIKEEKKNFFQRLFDFLPSKKK